jgi:RNA polymerase sigma-70 factor (ECF subfamily)
MTGKRSTPPLSSETRSLADSAEEKELSGWMRKSQMGDVEAYRQLLVRVKSMAEKYAKNHLGRLSHTSDSARDDVVQEILLAIHAKRQTYDPAQYFLPWLYAIARYKVIDSLRDSRKNQRNVELDPELTDPTQDRAEFEEAWAGTDTQTLLATLPTKQKQVLEMVKIEGLSISEASARTGFSESDIKVTVHRALKTLQQKQKGD